MRLLDEGLETPEKIIGATRVTVETPTLEMARKYKEGGVPRISELTVFPTTGDDDSPRVPEGHVRISGTLYELEDCRELNECPECGSDKVDATDDPPKCYTCKNELEDVQEDR